MKKEIRCLSEVRETDKYNTSAGKQQTAEGTGKEIITYIRNLG